MARRFRRGNAVKVQIFHYNSTTGTYPGTAEITTMCGYFQLDRHASALEGSGAGSGSLSKYDLILDYGVDVRLNDKVLINAETTIYKVMRIFEAGSGRNRQQRATIATDAQD
jgi:hypothetical protein